MSVSIAQTVRDIKALTRDETETVWNATADILPRINEALVRLYTVRPDAFYVTKVVVAPPDAITSATSGNLPVLDHYAPAIAAYAAHALLAHGKREGDAAAAGEQLSRWNLITFPRRR
jgi:hypothetical protein